MKNGLKRILITMLALVVCVQAAPLFAFAETSNFNLNMGTLTVNDTHTGVAGLPDGLSFTKEDPAGDGMKIYKVSDVMGLTGGQSALEFLAREQRANKPALKVDGFVPTAGQDFYITMNVYLGDATNKDYFVLRTNGNGYNYDIMMNGEGRITSRADYASKWANYEPQNWYRYTMAATWNASDENWDLKYYLDNQLIYNTNGSCPVYSQTLDKDVAVSGLGVQFGYVTGTTDFTGKAQWLLLSEMKSVTGTYVPENSNTTVTSSYTVTPGFEFNTGKVAMNSSVTGVPGNTTVSAFLDAITAPAGASKQVVMIAEDSKVTTVVDSSAYVTSDMDLLVTSADGSMKLYDIQAAASTTTLPTVTSTNAAYVVNDSAKTITLPDTTVATLKAKVTGADGATVKVVSASGYEVADAASITDTMKVVAEKGGVQNVYSLVIANLPFFAFDMETGSWPGTATITSATYNGSAWSHATSGVWSSQSGGASGYLPRIGELNHFVGDAMWTMVGLHNLHYDAAGTAVTNDAGATYTISHGRHTLDGESVYAFKMDHSAGSKGWSIHRSSKGLHEPTNYEAYDKMVLSYKLYLEDDAAAIMNVMYDPSQENYGMSLGFRNGEVKAGGVMASGNAGGLANAADFATPVTYQDNKLYDISLVHSVDGENLTVDYYINDVKVGTKTSRKSGITPTKGLYGFELQSLGTVYWGGIKLYMTDDFNPQKGAGEETDLTLDPAAGITVDAANKLIYGWEGKTVAQLKAAIDTDVNVEVTVKDAADVFAVVDNAPVAFGMYFTVTDKNFPTNSETYVLAKESTDSRTSVSVSGTTVTATRKICIFNAEAQAKNKTLILAVYKGDTLVKAIAQGFSIKASGNYEYSVSFDGYDNSMSYKAFFLDMTTLTPYEVVTD